MSEWKGKAWRAEMIVARRYSLYRAPWKFFWKQKSLSALAKGSLAWNTLRYPSGMQTCSSEAKINYEVNSEAGSTFITVSTIPGSECMSSSPACRQNIANKRILVQSSLRHTSRCPRSKFSSNSLATVILSTTELTILLFRITAM